MNETLQTIMNRRSIRKYQAKQIADSELQLILEAAINAPSARNQQKWHFTVIQNREKLDKMTAQIKENVINSDNEFLKGRIKDPAFSPFHNAPTVVVISGEDGNKFVPVDCGLAIGNIILAAASMNLGACVVGSPDMLFATAKVAEIKKELGIPGGYSHVCTVTLGYREGAMPEARPRSKDVITYIK
jgi:nitroreductase